MNKLFVENGLEQIGYYLDQTRKVVDELKLEVRKE
jgi:hypothetical protein